MKEGNAMKNSVREGFLSRLLSQSNYEFPIETGVYLGFYVPGELVLLNRVASASSGPKVDKEKSVFACPVSGLFR